MKNSLIILLLSAFTASAQVTTNVASLVHQSLSQSVTNLVEIHEADGSIHTDQRIVTAKIRDGYVTVNFEGREYGWPVRFGMQLSTNIVAGPTTPAPVKPIAPILPPQAADVDRGQSVERRAESERNKPK